MIVSLKDTGKRHFHKVNACHLSSRAGSHAETFARNSCHSSKAIYFVGGWCRIGSSFSVRRFARLQRQLSSIRFTTIQVTHVARAFCAIFIINGNEVKWIVWRHVFIAEWLPLSGSTRSAARKRRMRGSGWFVQTKETSGVKRYARYVAYMSYSSMVDILSYFFVRCLSRDSNFLCDVTCTCAMRNRKMLPVNSIALSWREKKLSRDYSKITS